MDTNTADKKGDKSTGWESRLTKLLFWSLVSLIICIAFFLFGREIIFSFAQANKANLYIYVLFASIIVKLLFISYVGCITFLFSIFLLKTGLSLRRIKQKQLQSGIINFFQALLVIFVLILFLSPFIQISPSRSKARDARRISDMRQLASAQEMYHGQYGAYLASAEFPAAIGTYLPQTPTNPTTGNYFTISNLDNNQEFCYYAQLENEYKKDKIEYKYYTAAKSGNYYRTQVPTTFAECNQND